MCCHRPFESSYRSEASWERQGDPVFPIQSRKKEGLSQGMSTSFARWLHEVQGPAGHSEGSQCFLCAERFAACRGYGCGSTACLEASATGLTAESAYGQDATWAISGWAFVVTADPDNRYSAVAVAISSKVATPSQITLCSWVPGRLLHVKCEGQHVTLDVVGIYQWVKRDDQKTINEARRSSFWTQLGRLLSKLPKRNLLVLLGDWNTPGRAPAWSCWTWRPSVCHQRRR